MTRRKMTLERLWQSVALMATLAGAVLGAGTKAAQAFDVGIYHASNWNFDVEAKLENSGRFSVVDSHNMSTYTPTLAELSGYDAVLVYTDNLPQNAAALGNVLANYVDAGGHVVVAGLAFAPANLTIGGRFATDGYLPFVPGPQSNGATYTLVKDLPGHPLLAGVNSFNGGQANYHQIVTLAPGALQVAHWSNGTPLVGVQQVGGNPVVGLNFYPASSDARGDFWDASTDGVRLMTNALLYTGSGITFSSPTNGQKVSTLSTLSGSFSGNVRFVELFIYSSKLNRWWNGTAWVTGRAPVRPRPVVNFNTNTWSSTRGPSALPAGGLTLTVQGFNTGSYVVAERTINVTSAS